MNKTISILFIIIIVLVGGYFLLNKEEVSAPVVTEEENVADVSDAMSDEEVVSEDAMISDDATGSDEAMSAEVKVFEVSGKNFDFSLEEIKVKKGDTVRIVFTTESGFHDWVVDEFDAATKQLRDGETDTIEFVAGESGSYEYYCSVGNHREQGMVGTLIVE